jgi:hypothetical protein
MAKQIRLKIISIITTIIVVLAGGCGYEDGNPRAARVVAQAYVNAYRARDAATICRVLAPELELRYASQGGGECARYLRTTFKYRAPALKLGMVHESEGRARVYVLGYPTHFIGLVKFGSLWRVVESWGLT